MTPVCTDHADWKGSCKLILLKTNEEISVKHRICDWQGHMYCFHFAEQPFCLSVSAPSHLNNDVQEHSLACPALCVENHSTTKKTRCSKTTFTSRSAVKWAVLAGGVVCNGKATSLLTTLQERRQVFEGTIYFLKNKKQPGVEISFENIWSVISSWSRRTVTCLFVFTAFVWTVYQNRI